MIRRMTPAMIINCKVLLKIRVLQCFLYHVYYLSSHAICFHVWFSVTIYRPMIPLIEFQMPVPIYRAVLPVYPSWPGSLSSYRCQRGTESLTLCWYLPGSQPSTSSRYGLVLVCKLQDALFCLFAGSLTKCMKDQIQGNVFCGTRSIMKV